eukprot:Nk52_evm15s1636 gene=Nk52_evmTU15s1636
MTKKSVVFIFALCALCTLSGPFHGSAEPIPSRGEDKAVDVEMTDQSPEPLLGINIDKGIELYSFRKRLRQKRPRDGREIQGEIICEYMIYKSLKARKACTILKPKNEVKCYVALSESSDSSCPEIRYKKIKVKYTTTPSGSSDKGDFTDYIVGELHISNVEIDTFGVEFNAPIWMVDYGKRVEALYISDRFNGYKVVPGILFRNYKG